MYYAQLNDLNRGYKQRITPPQTKLLAMGQSTKVKEA